MDVKYDSESELYSNIGDGFLRNVLMRNKENTGIQSIIQTIQEKQEEIRFYPNESSFIVQGCAGFGKTMVLLHRIRQLIYNKKMDKKDYIFLVSSQAFKDFVKSTNEDFLLAEDNILPYIDYYKVLVKTKKGDKEIQEENEMIFDLDYLAKIYSYKFIQDGYQQFFNILK